MATYNGARFVETQLESLTRNATPFSLHWIDDHSSDDTRRIVRETARINQIELREWQQPDRLGVPAVFFKLLECVEADIYLFCDQDDIWEPGKIDAFAGNLERGLEGPVLCFSEILMFRDGSPEKLFRLLDVQRIKLDECLVESRLFMSGIVVGNTQGFTRSLRDLVVRHKDVACKHAVMHDTWMYLIAVATGNAKLLTEAPTTRWRCHYNNTSGSLGRWRGNGRGYFEGGLKLSQVIRRVVATQARGLILASATLPKSDRLERALDVARLLSTFDKRQSMAAILKLFRARALFPNLRRALWLAGACLCTDARVEN